MEGRSKRWTTPSEWSSKHSIAWVSRKTRFYASPRIMVEFRQATLFPLRTCRFAEEKAACGKEEYARPTLALFPLWMPWRRYMHTGIKPVTVGENQPSENRFTWLAAFLAVHGSSKRTRASRGRTPLGAHARGVKLDFAIGKPECFWH